MNYENYEADLDTSDKEVDEHADYGDEVVDAEGDGKKDDEGKQPRDEKGKFAAKDTDEGEEADEGEESDEGDEDDEDGEGEGEEADEGEEARKANLPIRLNKMKEQRDRERERADTLARELEEAKKAGKKDEPADEKDPIDEISTELEALYEQVEEARADGDTKLAAKLQRQIDAGNRKIATIEAERVANRTSRATVESQRFNSMLDTMESMIPELDPNSDDYEEQAAKDIEELVVGYRHAGLSPTKALHKAVKLLHKVDLNAPAAPKREAKAEKKAEKKAEGKKPDIKKALDTQKRQPSDSSKRGADHDSQNIDIGRLSEDEFAKLPESVKAKYRGDEIE